ncbi:TPA: hypothetical protein EYM82_03290 [Candidatus Poribacteria bacterium]|nr:hypothetical protein [Candidatus Poribacteria bacterium]
MLSYCHHMAAWREAKHRYRLLMWPIFDISGDCSDSLARFQAYAAIAYGADGIWYFTYNGGGIMRLPKESEGEPSPVQTVEQVHQRLKPNYSPVAETNWRLRVWGQRLAGNDSAGVFSTGWNNRSWPFPEDLDLSGFDQVVPGPDKLIEKMSPDLLAGVLVRDGEAPQVMVVDCRVSKQYNILPPREVELDFHSTVQEVRIVSDQPQASDSLVPGSHVKLVLLAGKGHLLELSSWSHNWIICVHPTASMLLQKCPWRKAFRWLQSVKMNCRTSARPSWGLTWLELTQRSNITSRCSSTVRKSVFYRLIRSRAGNG